MTHRRFQDVFKAALLSRSPEDWATIIQDRIADRALRVWTANTVLHRYPGGKAYHTTLDILAEPYDSRENALKSEDLQRAYELIELPYRYCETEDANITRKRNGTYRRDIDTKALERTSPEYAKTAARYIKYHQQQQSLQTA